MSAASNHRLRMPSNGEVMNKAIHPCNVNAFVVAICDDPVRPAIAHRFEQLRLVTQAGTWTPTQRKIGANALIATWGEVTVDQNADDIVVGIFRNMRNDCMGIHAGIIRRLLKHQGDPGKAVEGLLSYPGGNYAAVAIEAHAQRAIAVTDPFRRVPLYRASGGGCTAFATDVRLLADLDIVPRELDLHSVFHYLNFSCIPAPHSIFRRIRKVACATIVSAFPGAATEARYWQPDFLEDIDGSEDDLAAIFGSCLTETVQSYLPSNGCAWGTFLSGGTDSSSITGILARTAAGDRIRTFSIGFDEQLFDELKFAKLAATRFNTDSKYRYVGEIDTVEAIPKLVKIYDEPYGNASAVPTYYCAALAADNGIERLIAGDGGDENFGGNERYAKDAVYRAYARLPTILRRGVARFAEFDVFDNGHFMRRIRNFVRRGATNNPERFYLDDSFASDFFTELLTDDLKNQILQDSSLAIVKDHYDRALGKAELHRLMYVDLMMAIADTDITKVHRAAQASGIDVAYPYLDTRLVEFAGRLRAKWKVRGVKKRYLFKQAVKGILPHEIMHKKKHGFGLPIAEWARRKGEFRELLHDTLHSQSFKQRGLVNPGFVDRLLGEHDRGHWDYSPGLWRLLMLELWCQSCLEGS